MSSDPQSASPENTIVSLVCNIILPVATLRFLSTRWGPGPALCLALAFPIGFGGYDLIRKRKANPFSLLGILNVSITGSLAWAGVMGFWFAVKEAAFPFLIGLFVLASSWSAKPAIKALFLTPALFHVDLLEARLREHKKERDFAQLLRVSTRWLAISFFLSATLNFALALRIFLPPPADMDAAARGVQLNAQIAQMTQWALLVTLLPSMAFLMWILMSMIRKIREMTGLTDDEFMKVK